MAIHENVPEGKKNKRVSAHVVARRLKMIAHRIVGKKNAMTSGVLAPRCGLERDTSNAKFRKAAKILLNEEKLAVISSTCGFWVADTVEEMDKFIENMESRITGLRRNVNSAKEIRENMRRPTDPQGDLFAGKGA